MASPIVGNEFADNEAGWEGGAVALVSSPPAFLDNRVTGNRTVSDGGGLHVCTTCYPHANPLVLDNTFTGNRNQLEGAAGVGAAFLRVFSWNEIHDNLKGDEPADFAWFGPLGGTDPEWSVQASIPNNWWGTTDAARIDATIHDGSDTEGFGKATWSPALDAPPARGVPRVTITTRHLVFDQAGEEMPVYLTLYNPGAAREVVLHVLLQYGDEAPMFYRGPLDFPGAVREADGLRLTLPADSVHFSILAEPAYVPGTTTIPAWWHAVLFDAATGERIGDPCAIRFDLAPGGAK
jgi:hypothetical protein